MTSTPLLATTDRKATLVLWDTPNMDMTLSNVIGGGKPSRHHRPDYSALASWLHHRAAAAGTDAVGVLALSVPRDAGPDAPVAKFVHVVRQLGFRVFLKPKDTPETDVDDDIVALAGSIDAAEVIVATHDSPLLDRVRAASSAPLVVLGFQEVFPAYRAAAADASFVDVGEIPGLFPDDLPRVATPAFRDLPVEGLLLAPLGPLVRVADQN
jgi:uncharacterized protein